MKTAKKTKDDSLVDLEFWDSFWQNAKLPRVRNWDDYAMQKVEKIFKKYLKKGRYKFIELGCAPASWLIYFNKTYGYEVHGIDYSALGVKISYKNAELCKTKVNVKEDDVLNHKLKKKSYDIVFSWGLVEHFTNTNQLVKIHKDLAKDEGLIVMCVPNNTGLNGFIQRIIGKEVFDSVKLISKEDLMKALKKNHLESIFTEYVGTFSVGLFSPNLSGAIGRKKHKLEGIRKFLIKATSGILKILPNWESGLTSPYIISISKKKAKK